LLGRVEAACRPKGLKCGGLPRPLGPIGRVGTGWTYSGVLDSGKRRGQGEGLAHLRE
jgi:hypothetical protein